MNHVGSSYTVYTAEAKLMRHVYTVSLSTYVEWSAEFTYKSVCYKAIYKGKGIKLIVGLCELLQFNTNFRTKPQHVHNAVK